MVPFEQSGINIYAAQVDHCIAHWHSAVELILVIRGTYRFVLPDHEVVVSAGGIIYLPANEIHGLSGLAQDSAVLTVQISAAVMQSIVIPEGFNFYCSAAMTSEHRELLSAIIDLAECRKQWSGQRPLLEMAGVYLIFDALLRSGVIDQSRKGGDRQRQQALIRRCMDIINEQHAMPLALKDIADQVHVSYHYLSRVFKSVCGYGFKEYLSFVRVEHAKSLLLRRDIPITNISQSCGFSEHKYLVLAFKRHVGMTPTQFRKNIAHPHSVASSNQHLMGITQLLPVTQERVAEWRLLACS